MFKGTPMNFEIIMHDEMFNESVITIMGDIGTFKSTLAYQLLYYQLQKNKNEIGVLLTLEQTKNSYIKNLKNLNIPLCKRFKITDMASIRSHTSFEDLSYLDIIIGKHIRRKGDYFVLDSLDALYFLMDAEWKNIRNQILELFYSLRKFKKMSFVILETFKGEERKENFISDGVIELGFTDIQHTYKRYIRILKMRGVNHYVDPFLFETGKHGIKIVGKLL